LQTYRQNGTTEEATMNKILIATDGSPEARKAVELGIQIASDHEAAVVFVQVIPPVRSTQFDPGVRIQAIPAELRLRRAVALHEAAQLAAEHGVQSTFEMLTGDPADEIVAYADSIDADLVVIGSRRRGVLASALLGSVSREVVQESRRPVLVVRGTSLLVDALASVA
jgi:nucleotide-binding universal stress UspA family protein